MKIPMVDLKRQYQGIREEINKAIAGVFHSGQFIMGPEVEKFEEELAQYCGTRYAVGVSSGTDALLLALMALDIKPGDEVITTAFTFIATAEVITLLGAKPVFVDISPHSYNIDFRKIEECISEKTRAIIPVHLYGHPADMDPIQEIAARHNLYIVEDVAQALGAEYKARKAGAIGHIGCLSFFPSKNLGAYGDAGAVLTNREELAKKVKTLRIHGSVARYNHKYIGINARLDALQAAILRVKLKHLDDWNERRIEHARRYTALLSPLKSVLPPRVERGVKSVFNQYTVQAEKRDELKEFLQSRGIASAVHYPRPLYTQEAFRFLSYKKGVLPVSESVSTRVLSLPIYPELQEREIEFIVQSLGEFYQ